MAQNITLLGASYSGVPSVLLPKTGGGTASFVDVTDTTATAADVAQGKYFHLATGERVQGTSTGGGGVTVESLSVTQNGTYTAPTGKAYSPVTVNVSGGGGGASIEWGKIRGDATLVKSWTYDKLIHEDENVDIPAYTTSQTTLKNGSSLTAESLNFADYSYMLLYRALATPIYSSSTKRSGRQIYYVSSRLLPIVFIPISAFSYDSTTATVSDSTQQFNANSTESFERVVYFNSASSVKCYNGSYGVNCNLSVAPSVSITNTAPYNTGTLNITSPTLRIRGNSNYLNSTNWGEITDIRYQYIFELYRVPRSSSVHGWEVESQFYHVLDCVNGNGTLT